MGSFPREESRWPFPLASLLASSLLIQRFLWFLRSPLERIQPARPEPAQAARAMECSVDSASKDPPFKRKDVQTGSRVPAHSSRTHSITPTDTTEALLN